MKIPSDLGVFPRDSRIIRAIATILRLLVACLACSGSPCTYNFSGKVSCTELVINGRKIEEVINAVTSERHRCVVLSYVTSCQKYQRILVAWTEQENPLLSGFSFLFFFLLLLLVARALIPSLLRTETSRVAISFVWRYRREISRRINIVQMFWTKVDSWISLWMRHIELL